MKEKLQTILFSLNNLDIRFLRPCWHQWTCVFLRVVDMVCMHARQGVHTFMCAYLLLQCVCMYVCVCVCMCACVCMWEILHYWSWPVARHRCDNINLITVLETNLKIPRLSFSCKDSVIDRSGLGPYKHDVNLQHLDMWVRCACRHKTYWQTDRQHMKHKAAQDKDNVSSSPLLMSL